MTPKKAPVFLWLLITALLILSGGSHLLADDRFIDNGDGTVTDRVQKLMWSQRDNESDINWEDANRWVKYNFCYLLPGNKFDDWRMPTVNELKSLFVNDESFQGEQTDCGMKVKVISQIKLSCAWIWTVENKNISANVFTFRLGYFFSDLKMHQKAHRVLAVRDVKE